MAGCGCGGGAKAAKEMARQLVQTFGSEATDDMGSTVLEYIGPGSGTQTYGGKGRTPSGIEYRAGGNAARRYITVAPEDVEYLLGRGLFQRHRKPAAFVPPPMVEEEPATKEPPTEEPIATDPVPAPRRSRKSNEVAA